MERFQIVTDDNENDSFDVSQITVVVQGPITKLTKKSLESVRYFLPKSKIILSTWANSNVEGLEFDEVIFNRDPYDNKIKYPTNINRMLISTLIGLKAVKSEYVLKIRTDFCLTGINFLKLFSNDAIIPREMNFFKKRIVSYAWKPQRGRLLQIGDFYFFGYTTDVLSLFEIPLSTNEDFFWLDNHKAKNKKLLADNTNRFHPEQHIWINFLEKNGVKIALSDYTDYNEEMKVLTEKTFANNIIIASFYDFSIFTLKENLLRYNFPIQKRGYNFSDGIRLTRKYVKENYTPSFHPYPFGLTNLVITKSIITASRLIGLFIPIKKFRRKIRTNFGKLAILYYNNGIL